LYIVITSLSVLYIAALCKYMPNVRIMNLTNMMCTEFNLTTMIAIFISQHDDFYFLSNVSKEN